MYVRMTKRRRLSQTERQEIVRETKKGVSSQTLATRFGVTARTIQYTIRRDKQRRRDSSVRTKQVSVTITPEELEAFEAVLKAQGVTSRSDGMRALIQAANGIFIADEELTGELKSFRAALNRVGNNVTQIAKRMHRANLHGHKPPFGSGSLAQMRSLAGYILDFSDQVDLLVRRRSQNLSLIVNGALRDLANG